MHVLQVCIHPRLTMKYNRALADILTGMVQHMRCRDPNAPNDVPQEALLPRDGSTSTDARPHDNVKAAAKSRKGTSRCSCGAPAWEFRLARTPSLRMVEYVPVV